MKHSLFITTALALTLSACASEKPIHPDTPASIPVLDSIGSTAAQPKGLNDPEADYSAVAAEFARIQKYQQHYEGYPAEIQNWPAKHFNPSEFASKGNGSVDIKVDLLQRLDAAREVFGQPIIITSGYRDPAHNRAVGGAQFSQHMQGTAVDISMEGMSPKTRFRLMIALAHFGFTSFGTYSNSPNMLHADIRSHAAIWHHGVGTHPAWFTRALHAIGWKPEVGPTKSGLEQE